MSRWGRCDFSQFREFAKGFSGFITTEQGAGKSVDELAREVLQGKWGNGAERKKRLEAAGYDYAAVQKKVNQLA